MNPFTYNRIMIVGNNGSGKSWFSRKLAAITGLPLIHLDVEFWQPGWKMPPMDQWLQRQRELVAEDYWIIEGNHTSTMETRVQAAELVILLDVNRFVCQTGVLSRCFQKRPDMPDYLNERFDLEFLKFCRGLWTYPHTRKQKMLALLDKYPETPSFIIRGRREMNRLVAEWTALPEENK